MLPKISIKASCILLIVMFLWSCEEEYPVNSFYFSEIDAQNKTLIYHGNKAGDFKAVANQVDWKSVERLIVKGHINQNDLYVLKRYIKPSNSNIKELDFSEVEILEGTFPEGNFEENNQLKRFVYPRRMMTTGDYILRNCWYLKEIIIPEELKVMGKGLFSAVGKPGYDADAGETIKRTPMKRERYRIPSTVKVLDAMAYMYYPYPTIEIPETVERIEAGCFRSSQMEHFRFPKNIKVIETALFGNCKRLKAVELHDEMTEIKSQAFYNCHNLEELVMPPSVSKVGSNFLFGTRNLKRIIWSPNITSFPEEAMANVKIEEFHVPENVNSLGRLCFAEAEIKRFYFHKNIKVLGEGLFNYEQIGERKYTPVMEELHVEWLTPPDAGKAFEVSISFGMGNPIVYPHYDFSKMTLYVPRGTKNLYANAEGWKKFGTIKEE